MKRKKLERSGCCVPIFSSRQQRTATVSNQEFEALALDNVKAAQGEGPSNYENFKDMVRASAVQREEFADFNRDDSKNLDELEVDPSLMKSAVSAVSIQSGTDGPSAREKDV